MWVSVCANSSDFKLFCFFFTIYLGGNSQNFLGKFIRFFLLWALKSWDYLGLKYFLKQISLKGDVYYCINHKEPIFYEQPLHKSTLKFKKILQIRLRSFVNFHPVLYLVLWVCIHVCVYVRARERERESVCVCTRVCVPLIWVRRNVVKSLKGPSSKIRTSTFSSHFTPQKLSAARK